MKKKTIALGAGLTAVLALGGAYVAAYFVAGNHVPAKARVAGVDIGGLSPAAAEQKLQQELGEAALKPIALSAGDITTTLLPADSGLSIDYAATVRAAGGGFSWNPVEIYNTLTGGAEVSLVRNVDDQVLEDAVSNVAPQFAKDSVDATLSFDQGEIKRSDGTEAQSLDVQKTVQATSEAFKAGRTEASAELAKTAPNVTTEMVDTAVKDYAQPLLSGPVTVKANGKSAEVPTAALSSAVSFEVLDGKLQPKFNTDALYEATKSARSALQLSSGKDASFAFKDGKVVVVPATTGQTVTKEDLVGAITKVAFAEKDKRITDVEVKEDQPKFTTKDAEALGEFQVVGEYTTYYPHAAYRNTNLGTAAQKINGTVLKPNDIFSLNNALGPRTPANGFTDGWVINGGRLVKESGGGISQSSTTLFNAAFFAGFKDVEHRPHTLYFDRYPAGREATIYYGSFDMRFQNDTKYPAIIQGYISPSAPGQNGSITFRIWSKPSYDMKKNDQGGNAQAISTELTKSDYYTGRDVVDTSANCTPQAPIKGFSVKWQRVFYLNGSELKRENYSWKYDAGDRITCG